MSYDEIVDKLQKLMLKEESCRKIGNLEEAAVYAAKVAEWAARYKVDVATLASESEKEAAAKGIGQDVVDATDGRGCRPVLWQAKIASLVCDYTGCVYCLMSHSSRILIIGKEVDRQLASYLTKMLCVFISKESQRQYDKEYYVRVEREGHNSCVLADYKASWITGALHILAERFNEMKKKIETEMPAVGFALILRKDVEASQKWLDENLHPKEKTFSRKTSGFNRLGFEHGATAAKNVSLNRPVGSGAARGVLA